MKNPEIKYWMNYYMDFFNFVRDKYPNFFEEFYKRFEAESPLNRPRTYTKKAKNDPPDPI